MIDLLKAQGEPTRLFFLNSQIKDKLIVDVGYISMGITEREWILQNELNEPVLKVLLPRLALMLHKDICICLKYDPIDILEIYQRKLIAKRIDDRN